MVEFMPGLITHGVDKPVKATKWRDRLLLQEDLNFLLTNRLPRRWATLTMGRLSRVRSPALTRLMIGVWRLFTDLDLSESPQRRYESLRDCFTRPLLPGARPFVQDPDVLCSPCDAIVGAGGEVGEGQLFQAKGYPYRIEELFGDGRHSAPWMGGTFVTLRLTSSMYHRFHAPTDAHIEHVRYISGDTWNVNPIALQRVERLFCRNERAVITMDMGGAGRVALVPVAAILVASMRIHALDRTFSLRYRGPNDFACDHAVSRGGELGWFEHGSTIIVFAPRGFQLAGHIRAGCRVRAGEELMKRQGALFEHRGS
jgi:phosphatidylserine decarboxylase